MPVSSRRTSEVSCALDVAVRYAPFTRAAVFLVLSACVDQSVSSLVEPGNAGSGGSAAGGGPGGATLRSGAPPALHVEGPNFVDSSGQRVILRGVSLADLLEMDTRRPGMSVRGIIDRVSDEADGFYARVVRLTVFPEDWLRDPEAYLSEHLRPAVEHASGRGLYVIVDWHEISDVAPVAERTSAFWQRVAPEFAGQGNVFYELFNEPIEMSDPAWSRWKAQAQPWVDSIREVADNVILIGGPFWSQRIEGAVTDPFEGPNLGYVGHVYPVIDPGVWAPGGALDRVSAVKPLFITEWGYRADGGEVWNATRQSFGEPLRDFIEPRGMSWTAWCADSDWAPMMFDSQWRLLTGDGEMGGFVKEWLADSRDDNTFERPELPAPRASPPPPSCSPASSPSEVLLDGRQLPGQLRLVSIFCLDLLTVSFDTCPIEGSPLIDCLQLFASVPAGSPPMGSGMYYDPTGLALTLEVTAGTLVREALIEGRPTQLSFSGTLTAPGGMTRPFELSASGCPEPLVCLL